MSFALKLAIFQDILSYFSFMRIKDTNIPPPYFKLLGYLAKDLLNSN